MIIVTRYDKETSNRRSFCPLPAAVGGTVSGLAGAWAAGLLLEDARGVGAQP